MENLIVFFGGANDSVHKNAKGFVERLIKSKRYGSFTGIIYQPWTSAAFWTNDGKIGQINKLLKNLSVQNVILVGHSYGGHSARKVANLIKHHKVDLLITIDGVSWESKLFWFHKPTNVKYWANVYCPTVSEKINSFNFDIDGSDLVSEIGGHWSIQISADFNLSIPHAYHNRFEYMYLMVEKLVLNRIIDKGVEVYPN